MDLLYRSCHNRRWWLNTKAIIFFRFEFVLSVGTIIFLLTFWLLTFLLHININCLLTFNLNYLLRSFFLNQSVGVKYVFWAFRVILSRWTDALTVLSLRKDISCWFREINFGESDVLCDLFLVVCCARYDLRKFVIEVYPHLFVGWLHKFVYFSLKLPLASWIEFDGYWRWLRHHWHARSWYLWAAVFFYNWLPMLGQLSRNVIYVLLVVEWEALFLLIRLELAYDLRLFIHFFQRRLFKGRIFTFLADFFLRLKEWYRGSGCWIYLSGCSSCCWRSTLLAMRLFSSFDFNNRLLLLSNSLFGYFGCCRVGHSSVF